MRKISASILLAGLGTLASGTAGAYSVFYGETARGVNAPPAPNIGEALLARDEFFSSLSGSNIPTPRVEDFETSPQPVNGRTDLVFGANSNRQVTARLLSSAGNGLVTRLPGEPAAQQGRYSVVGGSNFWQITATDSAASTFEIWFTNEDGSARAVEAFGFFGIDVGDFGGTLELDLLTGSASNSMVRATIDDEIAGDLQIDCDVTDTACDPYGLYNGSVRYIGLQASSANEYFNGVRFRAVLDPNVSGRVATDIFAFDSFTVVGAEDSGNPTPVPAPGTLALLGTALAGLALMRRRA